MVTSSVCLHSNLSTSFIIPPSGLPCKQHMQPALFVTPSTLTPPYSHLEGEEKRTVHTSTSNREGARQHSFSPALGGYVARVVPQDMFDGSENADLEPQASSLPCRNQGCGLGARADSKRGSNLGPAKLARVHRQSARELVMTVWFLKMHVCAGHTRAQARGVTRAAAPGASATSPSCAIPAHSRRARESKIVARAPRAGLVSSAPPFHSPPPD